MLLAPGPAKKVTIHLNEDTSSQSDYLSHEILSLLLREGVAGATLLRPEAGFGSHHRIHSQEGEPIPRSTCRCASNSLTWPRMLNG